MKFLFTGTNNDNNKTFEQCLKPAFGIPNEEIMRMQ